MSAISAVELEARMANPALFAAADDLAEAELARRAAIASGAAVWLSAREAAARIPHMTVQKLTALRKRQQGPNYSMPTFGTFMYLETDVEAYRARLEEAA